MRRVDLVLTGALGVALISGIVVDARRRARVVEHRGVGGAIERCQTCHPAGASAVADDAGRRRPHPTIEGHTRLDEHGCVACHGGDGRSVDRARAHRPLPGEGHPPFLPRPYFEVGCARCHVIGKLAGAPRLARGQREYVSAGCVACHLPGGRPGAMGFDLRFRPARTVEQIREHLLDPSSSSGRGRIMWTLRDATYRDQFASSPEGERALEALTTYLLALAESPERYQNAWARPKLRIDGKCASCHRMGGAPPTGESHSCPMLTREHPELSCERCHGSAATAPAQPDAEQRCPQLRALYPVCNTCHLRPDDGAVTLLER